MTVYVFEGEVSPRHRGFWIDSRRINHANPQAGVQFVADIEISNADVRVTVDDLATGADVMTLRNYVEAACQIIADAYAYLSGIPFIVGINRVTTADGAEPTPLDHQVPAISASESDRPLAIEELLNLVLSPNIEPAMRSQLVLALTNLREAMRSPHDTGFHCYRAIECIRQFFGEGSARHWERMAEALRIDRTAVDRVREFARPQRHGADLFMSDADRGLAMQLTWRIMDRFVLFVRNGGRALTAAEHNTLTYP